MSAGLAQGPTWWLEWDSSLRPSGCKAPNLPLSHHAPLMLMDGQYEYEHIGHPLPVVSVELSFKFIQIAVITQVL